MSEDGLPAAAEADARTRLGAELLDNPNVTLGSLPEVDQQRIKFRVLAVDHAPGMEDGVGDSMGPVDYCVVEAPLTEAQHGQYGDRITVDSAINLRINGIGDEAGVPRAPVVPLALGVVGAVRRHGWAMPVVRTMDISGGDTPLDPRYKTYDAQKLACDDLERQQNAGFWSSESVNQRHILRDYIRQTGLLNAAREQVDRDQLSVIAANAALRHPEKQEIVIGIVAGAIHSQGVLKLADGTQCRVEGLFIPPAAERIIQTQLGVLLRRAASLDGEGQEPYDMELNRVLVSEMVDRLLQAELAHNGRTGSTYVLSDDLVRSGFSDDQVAQTIEAVDTIKRDASEAGYVMHRVYDYLTSIKPEIKEFFRATVVASQPNASSGKM